MSSGTETGKRTTSCRGWQPVLFTIVAQPRNLLVTRSSAYNPLDLSILYKSFLRDRVLSRHPLFNIPHYPPTIVCPSPSGLRLSSSQIREHDLPPFIRFKHSLLNHLKNFTHSDNGTFHIPVCLSRLNAGCTKPINLPIWLWWGSLRLTNWATDHDALRK